MTIKKLTKKQVKALIKKCLKLIHLTPKDWEAMDPADRPNHLMGSHVKMLYSLLKWSKRS